MKKKAIAICLSLGICASTPGKIFAAADPMIGEVMLVGFTFCPLGWVEANGQLLSISSNTALFSLYGTIYGGDGITTFAIPDLRGRTPIHNGTGPGLQPYSQGSKGGNEYVLLTEGNMPMHSHAVNTTNKIANKNGPGTDFLAVPDMPINIYHEGPPNRVMDSGMIGNTGGSQPLLKRSPYLTMKYCVATVGIYPSRS